MMTSEDLLFFMILAEAGAIFWLYARLKEMASAQQKFADANMKTAKALTGLQHAQELTNVAIKQIAARSKP